MREVSSPIYQCKGWGTLIPYESGQPVLCNHQCWTLNDHGYMAWHQITMPMGWRVGWWVMLDELLPYYLFIFSDQLWKISLLNQLVKESTVSGGVISYTNHHFLEDSFEEPRIPRTRKSFAARRLGKMNFPLWTSWNCCWNHLGVSENSGTPKWMVYKGKPC